MALRCPRSRRRRPDLDAVDVGEHPVEHDQVGIEARDRRERLAAGRRLLDLEPLVAEGGRNRVDDGALVVYDEDLPPADRLLPEAAHTHTVPTSPVNRLRAMSSDL